MNNQRLVLTFVVISLILLLVGSLDYQDVQMEYDHYCEMVTIYHTSKGELGWPPFKGGCHGTQQ